MSQPLTVSVFGRDIAIEEARIDRARGTLSLVSCLEGLSKADVATLDRAQALLLRIVEP